MELVWSTADFRLNGVAYPGFPILLDSEMGSVAPANAFLRYHLLQRGRVGSRKSWNVYGQAIYDYFSFLEAHNLAWDVIPGEQAPSALAAYRDYSRKTIQLSRNTVRQRLYLIQAFYIYAQTCGWIKNLPFSKETTRAQRADRLLQHIDASGGKTTSTDVMPRHVKQLPKFLAGEEIRKLLAHVNNPHHKMIIRMALQTGLRREEIATFPWKYLPSPSGLKSGTRNIKIHIDPEDGLGIRTKGGKARTIYLSRSLVEDLWHYYVHLRGEHIQSNQNHVETLFVNQDGRPYANGGKGLERIVRDLGRKIGIEVWMHKLRHTYATHTLYELQQSDSSIEPLIFLRNQLGHESLETTMIYTHLIDEITEQAILRYDEEVSHWSHG